MHGHFGALGTATLGRKRNVRFGEEDSDKRALVDRHGNPLLLTLADSRSASLAGFGLAAFDASDY